MPKVDRMKSLIEGAIEKHEVRAQRRHRRRALWAGLGLVVTLAVASQADASRQKIIKLLQTMTS